MSVFPSAGIRAVVVHPEAYSARILATPLPARYIPGFPLVFFTIFAEQMSVMIVTLCIYEYYAEHLYENTHPPRL